MDLREYIQIIKKNFRPFLGVIAAVILASFAFLALKPVSYTTSLLLNIARSGSQETSDYKYDDFYRIQADEKFAETVVQWLASPAIEADIFKNAGISVDNFSLRQLSKSFKAEKLSPEVVVVGFSTPDREQAKKISAAISDAITKNTENLNKGEQENGWFMVVAHEPIIVKNSADVLLVFLASAAAGIFLAFWTILIIHYLK